MELRILYACLFFHFIADSLFQTRAQLENKAENFLNLIKHSLLYTAVLGFFILAGTWLGDLGTELEFEELILNYLYCGTILFFSHAVIDWGSSRVLEYYWKDKRRYNYFLATSLDQVAHLTILVFLVSYFLP